MKNAFKEAESYMRQQERVLTTLPEEELLSFVVASLQKLTAEHFIPIVRGVCDTTPITPSVWFQHELLNSADNTIATALDNLLPACYIEEAAGSRTDGLLLAMDNGLCKIKTWSGDAALSSGTASMQVSAFTPATPKEAKRYRRQRAELQDIIAPDVSIIVPRKSILCGRWSDPEGAFTCAYTNYADERRSIRVSQKTAHSSPQELTMLHGHFVQETRIALAGLRTVAR